MKTPKKCHAASLKWPEYDYHGWETSEMLQIRCQIQLAIIHPPTPTLLARTRADPVPEAPTWVGSGEGKNRGKPSPHKICGEAASNLRPGDSVRQLSPLHQARTSLNVFNHKYMTCQECKAMGLKPKIKGIVTNEQKRDEKNSDFKYTA